MKRKRDKHTETRFTDYLDKDEHLIWVGEAKTNSLIPAWLNKAPISVGLTGFSFFTIVIIAGTMPVFTLLPIILFAGSLLPVFVRLTYYAVSNKRLFILKGKELSISPLTHLQKISIGKSDGQSFNLNFMPLRLIYEVNHDIKQDYPIDFAENRLEGLSEEDVNAAYDLLMAEREERVEELGLPE